MGGPIQFEEIAKIGERLASLREELASLAFERDDLLAVVCPNIAADYLLRFGGITYRIASLSMQIERAKRKLEMIRERVNRLEPVDAAAIEAALDAEFEVFRAGLEAQLAEVNRAIYRSKNGFILSDADAATAKQLYRAIVRAMHPDIHPYLSEEKLDLFINAADAYFSSSLAELKIIYDISADEKDRSPSSLSEAEKESARLEVLIDDFKQEIASIKSSQPYIYHQYLESEETIAAHEHELEQTLALCEAGLDEALSVIAKALELV